MVTVAGSGREMAAAMAGWHVDLVVLDPRTGQRI